MAIASVTPLHVATEVFPLEDANEALLAIANDAVRGAAVLEVAER